MCPLFLATGIMSVLLLALALRMLLKYKNRTETLIRPQWKRDMIYLVQFPISPHVRSLSPFVLKLETWLRMTGIPYENVYSTKFGKKGQIPYIELNGEQIPDSNVIIDTIKKDFWSRFPALKCDDQWSAEQLATAHATKVMLENHTTQAGFYWRYGLHMEEFYAAMIRPSRAAYPSALSLLIFRYVQPIIFRLRTFLSGLGRHSEQEIAHFSCQDLKAVSDYLGEKSFYLGDTASSIDCVLFGHLAQFLYIPMPFPQKLFMQQHCANLVAYVDRMRQTFWPDWEQMCEQQCMAGHLGC